MPVVRRHEQTELHKAAERDLSETEATPSGAGVDAAGTLLTQSFDLASVDRHSDTSASAGRKGFTADKQPPGARMTHP